MTCRKCGSENAPGSGFCNRCGAKLKSPEKPRLQKQPRERVPRQRKEKGTPKSRGGGLLSSQYSIFLIFLIVLFGVIIIGVLFMIPKGEEPEPELTETEKLEQLLPLDLLDLEVGFGLINLVDSRQGGEKGGIYRHTKLRGNIFISHKK